MHACVYFGLNLQVTQIRTFTMDPNEHGPEKYLELKPRKTNIKGIFRVLSSDDYVRECKDFIELVQVNEEMVERGVVFASMLAQKVLQYIEKPMSLLGSGLEMCLNIICNTDAFQVFLKNLLRGNVVMPSKSSASYVSIIGLVDSRVHLDINIRPQTNKYFAALCAMASKLAYENRQYIQIVVEKTWKMELLGSFSFWDERYKADTTQAFLFRDTTTNPDTIVVAFRGTEPFNANDWITDCDISWCKLPTIGGRVHSGFVRALGIAPNTTPPVNSQNAYATITELLNSRFEANSATRLVVTGHSLGGALAVLFAASLVMRKETRVLDRLDGVYTFGQPRVGDVTFGKLMEEKFRVYGVEYYRFVYSHDIVPRLPFDSSALMFKHFGTCIYVNTLYEAKIVKEEPLKNYFKCGSFMRKRMDAIWEVVRSFLLPRMFGADYMEGWVLIMLRMIGIVFPGLPDHGLQDYINATRFATY